MFPFLDQFTDKSTGENSYRLRRIEQKLDAILNHLGIEVPADTKMEEVSALALAGRKIEAIKAYRQRTGAGLSEAKTAVEAMVRG